MISLEAITRDVGGRTLFAEIWWTINPGERIGLVGPNGCGKSTLLRIIAGLGEPDAGTIRRRPHTQVSYLPQEVEAEICEDTTVLDAALAGAEHVREIGRDCDRLAERMAALAAKGTAEEELHRVSEEYGSRRALFEWAGGDGLEARARIVLGGLGFRGDDLHASVMTLSGGWRMRVLMARMLLSGADLMLLDEPTNHLDLDALEWLEGYLSTSPSAVIVVSHDRFFLDRVVVSIADLVGEKLRLTAGSYSAWVRARQLEREQTERRAAQLAQEEARLERFVERFGAKATKAAQATDRKRALGRVREEKSRLTRDPSWGWTFRWPEALPSPDIQATLEGVSKRYGETEVFAEIGLEIRRGERLAILGPNGAGKTTLLRILAGEELASGGRRLLAPGLVIGRFAQHQLETMDPARTVLEEASRGAPSKRPEELRKALGSLGLTEEHVSRPVGTLSGGERSRLALARLLLNPCAMLLLDEPTNHLDLPLREALERALMDWEGTLLVVSHDRAFLSKLTRGALVVERGGLQRITGGWQEWMAWRAARETPDRRDAGPDAKVHEKSREGRRERAAALQERSRRLRPLREDVARLEAEVETASARLNQVDRDLADPSLHSDGLRMRDLGQERGELVARLAELEECWAEAAQELEDLLP